METLYNVYKGLLAGFWRAKSEEETYRGEELRNGI
jgi:hypothetical protein